MSPTRSPSVPSSEPASSLADDADRLAHIVNGLLVRYLVRGADGQERAWPYNPVDYGTLRYLGSRPGARATDVARHLGTPATTMQSALDRLLRAGLLHKRRHASDGRARAYTLSPAGQDVLARIEAQDRANMAELLANLPPRDRAALLKLLDRVVSD